MALFKITDSAVPDASPTTMGLADLFYYFSTSAQQFQRLSHTSLQLFSGFVSPKTDVAGLAAVDVSGVQTGSLCYVIGLANFFFYDSASVEPADNLTVIEPSAGSGRWLVFQAGSGGTNIDNVLVSAVNGSSLVDEITGNVLILEG